MVALVVACSEDLAHARWQLHSSPTSIRGLTTNTSGCCVRHLLSAPSRLSRPRFAGSLTSGTKILDYDHHGLVGMRQPSSALPPSQCPLGPSRRCSPPRAGLALRTCFAGRGLETPGASRLEVRVRHGHRPSRGMILKHSLRHLVRQPPSAACGHPAGAASRSPAPFSSGPIARLQPTEAGVRATPSFRRFR